MANVDKGFRRIVWVVSTMIGVCASIFAFSTGNIFPVIPEKGYSLINYLDENPSRAKNLNLEKVTKEFPALDTILFRLRYDLLHDTLTNAEKVNYAKKLEPGELFKLPVRIGMVLLNLIIGIAALMLTWLIWFVIRWIVMGFKCK
jgi:hypothetical protein